MPQGIYGSRHRIGCGEFASKFREHKLLDDGDEGLLRRKRPEGVGRLAEPEKIAGTVLRMVRRKAVRHDDPPLARVGATAQKPRAHARAHGKPVENFHVVRAGKLLDGHAVDLETIEHHELVGKLHREVVGPAAWRTAREPAVEVVLVFVRELARINRFGRLFADLSDILIGRFLRADQTVDERDAVAHVRLCGADAVGARKEQIDRLLVLEGFVVGVKEEVRRPDRLQNFDGVRELGVLEFAVVESLEKLPADAARFEHFFNVGGIDEGLKEPVGKLSVDGVGLGSLLREMEPLDEKAGETHRLGILESVLLDRDGAGESRHGGAVRRNLLPLHVSEDLEEIAVGLAVPGGEKRREDFAFCRGFGERRGNGGSVPNDGRLPNDVHVLERARGLGRGNLFLRDDVQGAVRRRFEVAR